MTALIMDAYRPSPLYIAMPNADREGWWLVTEGEHVGAPIVCHCPNEVFARAIAQALNNERSLALKHIGAIVVNVRRAGAERLN